MKDSKVYGQKIKKLFTALKKTHKKEPPIVFEDPIEAIVCAIISEQTTDKETQNAMERLKKIFVDITDLRVSLADERLEMLGSDTPVTRHIAETLGRTLNYIFNKYNCLEIEELKKGGKRNARQILEKIEGLSPYAINFCMLTSCNAHAIPLNQTMLDFLKKNEFVHPESDEKDIDGFLTRLIVAKDANWFFVLLKRCCESGDFEKFLKGSPSAAKKKEVKKSVKKTKVKRKK
ncbi:MAG: hypothetical protein PHF37_05615 [Phycisphaerae bacterium]|nr:hypothetical protein [Phycisphaerae bacterium]